MTRLILPALTVVLSVIAGAYAEDWREERRKCRCCNGTGEAPQG